jgi:hypothetical protein
VLVGWTAWCFRSRMESKRRLKVRGGGRQRKGRRMEGAARPKHVRVGRREVGASMRFAVRVEEERIRGKDCWRIYTFSRGQSAKQTRRTYQPTDGRFSVLFVETRKHARALQRD